MTSRITAINSPLAASLDMRDQGKLRGMSRFERREYGVGINGRAPKNFIAKRVRECVQNRSAPASHWRLAHTASSYRRLGIGNIESSPLHVHGNIENCGRLGL